MIRLTHAAALAGFIAWWAPTLAGVALPAVPYVVAALGTGYRVRRFRRLIARGEFDETERVVDALHRERAAAERWCGGVRP